MKTNMIKLIGASVIALFMTNCSSVSKKSCNNTNWNEQGKKDGQAGKAAEEILKTEKACTKKGSEFPITDYKKGWVEGIAMYCSPSNGFKMASQGKEVKISNCPVELRPELEANIADGKKYSSVKKEIKKLEKQKNSVAEERKEAKDKLSHIDSELEKLQSKREELSKKLVPSDNAPEVIDSSSN